MGPQVGWLQLRHQPARFAVALVGIAFAVLLILMQLGFRAALFESAVRFQERFDYDIALFSTDSVFIVRPEPFSIRRLYQAMGHEAVKDISPVYIFPATWKNPWNNQRRSLSAIGFDPEDDLLDTEGFEENRLLLRQQDVVLFDAASRPEFGPVAETLAAGQPVVTEINDREIEVVGSFRMGTSFGIDAIVLTSEDNWLRLFPERPRDEIQLGLIQLGGGEDPETVRDELREYLPKDVLVMTKADFIQRETDYWNAATPIGYVFAFGAIVGLVVGSIIVYQILFADVSDHLPEYATLRAMGYSNGYLSRVVLQQALILAVLGFLPGAAISIWLYHLASEATRLPIYLTPERALLVLILTVAMCSLSALLALRKVRSVDPAEVF